MRRGYIIALVAFAGACAVSGLMPDRPADPPPPGPATSVVAEVSAESLAFNKRAAEKEQLVVRLINDDLRLADAVGAFIALNRDWPSITPQLYEKYPGRSLGERVAHLLVWEVDRLTADDPRRDAILRRLAAELGDIAAAGDGPAPEDMD